MTIPSMRRGAVRRQFGRLRDHAGGQGRRLPPARPELPPALHLQVYARERARRHVAGRGARAAAHHRHRHRIARSGARPRAASDPAGPAARRPGRPPRTRRTGIGRIEQVNEKATGERRSPSRSRPRPCATRSFAEPRPSGRGGSSARLPSDGSRSRRGAEDQGDPPSRTTSSLSRSRTSSLPSRALLPPQRALDAANSLSCFIRASGMNGFPLRSSPTRSNCSSARSYFPHQQQSAA